MWEGLADILLDGGAILSLLFIIGWTQRFWKVNGRAFVLGPVALVVALVARFASHLLVDALDRGNWLAVAVTMHGHIQNLDAGLYVLLLAYRWLTILGLVFLAELYLTWPSRILAVLGAIGALVSQTAFHGTALALSAIIVVKLYETYDRKHDPATWRIMLGISALAIGHLGYLVSGTVPAFYLIAGVFIALGYVVLFLGFRKVALNAKRTDRHHH